MSTHIKTNEFKAELASMDNCTVRTLQCVVEYCKESLGSPSPSRVEISALLIVKFGKEYPYKKIEQSLNTLKRKGMIRYESAFRFVATPRGIEFVRMIHHHSPLHTQRSSTPTHASAEVVQ